jgi:hypothetical protein
MRQEQEALYIDQYRGSEFDYDERVVFHLAGQAVAIYEGNKQKQLPSVHFNILINQEDQLVSETGRLIQTYDRNSAKIIGGRLIQGLPVSFAEATLSLSWFHQAEYRSAFEADIINLLAGPLAEAKHIALQDGEVFNSNLVNLKALKNYGGSSEIELVNEYMECYKPNKGERRQKLRELFLAAFGFVDNSSNWRKISALAEFLQEQPNGIIHCEDIIAHLANLKEVVRTFQ